MKNKKNISVAIFALVAAVVLGIGYAAITAITLNITGSATANPDDANFVVKFLNEESSISTTNATAEVTGDKVAQFTTTGLTAKGDEASATFTIKNASPDLTAKLTATASGTNSEYFEVSHILSTDTVAADGTATLTVKVTVKKTPIDGTKTDTVTAIITAAPQN